MANRILTLSIMHPVLAAVVVLGFFATCLTYIASDFTNDNLVIGGDLNAGTFLGTFVHLNWGHYLGNIVMLIPVWIYADKLAGKTFITIIVIANILITGIYCLISDNRLCGLSGVVFMLVGFTAIAGNWLMFFFAAALFFGEFTLLGKDDSTAHLAHILFFVMGIVIGFVKVIFLG